TGALIILGGLAVIAGKMTKVAAWCLFAYVLIVSFWMHAFWGMPTTTSAETMAKMNQMTMFLKNMGMAGGALLLAHFGPGPMSLDAKKHYKPARRARLTRRFTFFQPFCYATDNVGVRHNLSCGKLWGCLNSEGRRRYESRRAIR